MYSCMCVCIFTELASALRLSRSLSLCPPPSEFLRARFNSGQTCSSLRARMPQSICSSSDQPSQWEHYSNITVASPQEAVYSRRPIRNEHNGKSEVGTSVCSTLKLKIPGKGAESVPFVCFKLVSFSIQESKYGQDSCLLITYPCVS